MPFIVITARKCHAKSLRDSLTNWTIHESYTQRKENYPLTNVLQNDVGLKVQRQNGFENISVGYYKVENAEK